LTEILAIYFVGIRVKWEKLFTDNAIAIAATIIALASLILSFWEGHEADQHNRIEIEPYLGLAGI
jgi:hypothetical protein